MQAEVQFKEGDTFSNNDGKFEKDRYQMEVNIKTSDEKYLSAISDLRIYGNVTTPSINEKFTEIIDEEKNLIAIKTDTIDM